MGERGSEVEREAGETAAVDACRGYDWVSCDACGKWRRLVHELAASLDDSSSWYCSSNPDPQFNSCEHPQEFSDAEIDAMIENQNGANAEAQAGRGYVRGKKRPAVWQLVTANLYPHRSKKQLDDDEIMVCQCRNVVGTDDVACGEHCLNRMLNIECVETFCPNGSRCTNRVFSQRKYASLDIRRAGRKGFGLFAKEDLKAGQFIVEYVGEVLDEEEYVRRKQFYEASHQRHYYFMNIGNGEVVDATRKGGVGRFINHSCSPNCETQKWVVQGELSIGLFTLKDIPAGTELTFDYNFERYGDKPVKCLCGTPACRGLIGGERETADTVGVEITATEEEEDLEPIMVTEKEGDDALDDILDRVIGLGWEDGWTPMLQKKLEKLARSRGIDLPKFQGTVDGPSVDDESFLKAAAQSAFSSMPDSVKRAKSRFSSKMQRSSSDPDWKGPQERAAASEKKAARKKPAVANPSKEIYINNRVFVATSEVQRQVKSMLTQSGRLKNTSREGVVDFLRLFNLCDLGSKEIKADKNTLNGSGEVKCATHLHPEREEARQRARCVDLSFLMDIVTRTDGLTAKHTFVEMGLLRQMLLIMACRRERLSEQIIVIFRKALRMLEALPFTSDIVKQTRSAHTSFEDMLKEFTSHPDYELKNRAWALIKKWSLSQPDSQRNFGSRPPYDSSRKYAGGSSLNQMKTPSVHADAAGGYSSRQQFSNSDSKRSYEYGNYKNDWSSSGAKGFGSTGYNHKRTTDHVDSEDRQTWKRSRWDEADKKEEPRGPPPQPSEPEFSPMTDEEQEDGMLPSEPAYKKPEEANRIDILDTAAPELISDPFDNRDQAGKPVIVYVSGSKTWDYPDESFEKFVVHVVRRQLSKHEDKNHPMHLEREEAASLFSKIRKDIMAGEKEAYKKRQSKGQVTLIEQGKSESRIKQYIKDKVQRFLSVKS